MHSWWSEHYISRAGIPYPRSFPSLRVLKTLLGGILNLYLMRYFCILFSHLDFEFMSSGKPFMNSNKHMGPTTVIWGALVTTVTISEESLSIINFSVRLDTYMPSQSIRMNILEEPLVLDTWEYIVFLTVIQGCCYFIAECNELYFATLSCHKTMLTVGKEIVLVKTFQDFSDYVMIQTFTTHACQWRGSVGAGNTSIYFCGDCSYICLTTARRQLFWISA